MAKPNYTKSSASLDMEERAKKDWQPSSVLVPGQDPQLSDNGFIGVDPIYQNFADEKFAPLQAEKGPEADIEASALTDDADYKKAAAEEGEGEAPKEESTSGSTTPNPSTPPPPPSGSSTTK